MSEKEMLLKELAEVFKKYNVTIGFEVGTFGNRSDKMGYLLYNKGE